MRDLTIQRDAPGAYAEAAQASRHFRARLNALTAFAYATARFYPPGGTGFVVAGQ
ncbi:hypothetical protein GCM10010471_16270 [Leucobacter komagatae]